MGKQRKGRALTRRNRSRSVGLLDRNRYRDVSSLTCQHLRSVSLTPFGRPPAGRPWHAERRRRGSWSASLGGRLERRQKLFHGIEAAKRTPRATQSWRSASDSTPSHAT